MLALALVFGGKVDDRQAQTGIRNTISHDQSHFVQKTRCFKIEKRFLGRKNISNALLLGSKRVLDLFKTDEVRC